MLRKAGLGFNFTGSYKKDSVIVGKRLLSQVFFGNTLQQVFSCDAFLYYSA